MIYKPTLVLISVIFITGCAQTQIYHPSKPLHMYDIDKSECTNLVNQSNPSYDDSTRQCAYVGTTLQCRNNDSMIASTRAFQNSLRAFEVRDEITKCMERRGWRQEILQNNSINNSANIFNATSDAKCDRDIDCPGRLLCRSKRCVNPGFLPEEKGSPYGASCNTSTQCKGALICIENRCIDSPYGK
jgi:hypothetical protein